MKEAVSILSINYLFLSKTTLIVVPVTVLVTFKRLAQISDDVDVIFNALKSYASEVYEVVI
jgi:hypothetical protein